MSIVSHQVESTDSTTSTTTATTTAKSATAAMEEGGEAGGKSDFDDKIHTVDTPGSTSSAAPVAAFQGSFIRNQLGHVPPPPSRPTKLTSARQWRCYFAAGWRDPHHWKAAFVEFVASTSLTLTSAFIDVTIGNFNTPQIPAYVGVTNIVLLTLFIMAAAPGSGGHINPLISYSTLLTGLSGFSRAILYMAAQTAGAGLAGGILRGIFGPTRSIEFHGGGCYRDPGTVTAGQALLVEIFSSFILLFLAYGVALDPRQGKLFGPLAGPAAVGLSLGLTSFATAGLVPGYTGASMNPARCFAYAITRRGFGSQWIWWTGPALGGILHALTYYAVPPYHSLSKDPPK